MALYREMMYETILRADMAIFFNSAWALVSCRDWSDSSWLWMTDQLDISDHLIAACPNLSIFINPISYRIINLIFNFIY